MDPDKALPRWERPMDDEPVSTTDLPATPTRDRTIGATAWREAPPAILALAEGLPPGPVGYVRRIGPWLLWKAGPLEGPEARYAVVAADDLSQVHTFEIHHDGTASGHGPSGAHHDRFRAWKEDVRDHPPQPARDGASPDDAPEARV